MKRVVILGCGYVGVRAARLFAGAGWEVTGVTRSAESAARLATEQYRLIACDIANAAALSGAAALRGAEAVISCVSAGGGGEREYREVYLNGLQNAVDVLRPRHVLFTSSTSVYAQCDGEWVTEESPAEPQTATSRVLREAEEVALRRGGWVARLAGIYGPGRSVLLRKFFDKTSVIETGGARYINQIHADDAASALFHLIGGGVPPGIYNVADDLPQTQLAFHQWLAEHFNKPLPPCAPADPNRKRGLTNKRVSNAKLRASGWAPVYPSFQEALARDPGLLAGARAGGSGDARP